MSDLPPAGRFDGRAHLIPIRIYYEDTDFSGLVYHANYLRYFERGRSDFLRAAGIGHSALLAGENPTAFAILRIELDFKQAARIDDALVVRTCFDRVEGARLHISQAIMREGRTITAAAVEACCITPPHGRPKRAPEAMITQLKPFLLQA
jgi:acyl-CoA thioester hydrolase